MACTQIPRDRTAVDTVEIIGTNSVDPGDIEDRIATTPSGKFLGLFRGVVYDYSIYDPVVLQRDLARVERYLHGQGFPEARARAGRVMHVSPNHVRVEIIVREGPAILNRKVAVLGLEGIPEPISNRARRAAERQLPVGGRFDEDAYHGATAAVQRALTEHGYAYAKVQPDATFDLGSHTADYVFRVRPGPVSTIGPISIVGLDSKSGQTTGIEAAPLRRSMGLEVGDPYSTAALDAAAASLLDLQVLSSVEISPQLSEPPPASPASVPIVVHVEPTRVREVRLGAGFELDEIKTDVHLVLGWEDRNFLGDLRDLSIEFKPGAVLYPTRLNHFVRPNKLLPEERFRVQLRQPAFLEARTAAFIRPELNVYPLLVDPNAPTNAPVIGYRELRVAAGVDRPFGKFFASLAHNVQAQIPFTYAGVLDPALRSLLLSYPQLITSLDLRRNAVHPRKGIYLSNDLQVAGGPFGGDARDVRVQPEARAYVPLHRKVTYAARASIGLLFPSNYGGIVQNDLRGAPTDQNRSEWVRDVEIVYFRGFSSGGPNSNRGYPLRGIAPHGIVPFLSPETAAQQIALNCDPSRGAVNSASCSIPIGGFSLWELSNEVRFAVAGPFASALFCDMSDVSPHVTNLRFDHLHLSCGLGVRYDTPVGPIRLDVGYRIQPLQVLGFRNEIAAGTADPVEGIPPRLLGVPIAVAFGIGEAY